MKNIFFKLREKLLEKKNLRERVKKLEKELKYNQIDIKIVNKTQISNRALNKKLKAAIEEKINLSALHEKEMEYLEEVKFEKRELQKRLEKTENNLKKSESLREINKMLINRNRRLEALMKRKKPKVA